MQDCTDMRKNGGTTSHWEKIFSKNRWIDGWNDQDKPLVNPYIPYIPYIPFPSEIRMLQVPY